METRDAVGEPGSGESGIDDSLVAAASPNGSAGQVTRRTRFADLVEDLHELVERGRIFGIAFCGIALDLGFLLGWLWLTKIFHFLFEKLGTVPGISEVLQNVLTLVFDFATLSVVAAYTLYDVVRSVKRIWKKNDKNS
jgi:hypothetical protein